MKRKVSMTLDEHVFRSFQNYCELNGMKVSTKVEVMMKKTVEEKKDGW